ncbi:hypothetical protein GCM10027612_15510 [Microbispora bryophytorum subsp. camponoti]
MGIASSGAGRSRAAGAGRSALAGDRSDAGAVTLSRGATEAASPTEPPHPESGTTTAASAAASIARRGIVRCGIVWRGIVCWGIGGEITAGWSFIVTNVCRAGTFHVPSRRSGAPREPSEEAGTFYGRPLFSLL